MQIDNSVIDQIAQNVLGVFDKMGSTHQEFVRKIREVVREGVEHFDLVTHEEFDSVRELLSNTRIKVDRLEKRVAELEAVLGEVQQGKGGDGATS
ncbi:MAG: accessory factor UbiK family protein [Magnetococcales bacterium]|nr:accessory factor UbiK family protein [Magnetococcales bacterium]